MSSIIIDIPQKDYRSVWRYLLPACSRNEEVCFLHVRPSSRNDAGRFCFDGWDPILPREFAFRSSYHLELTDQAQARIIKRAADLGTSLVEMHSHTGSWPAAFSASDMVGLSEFVPHVLWRLRKKPYFAIVVARGSFDGLVWLGDGESPQRLDGIAVGTSVMKPTGLSPLEYESHGH